MPIASISTEPRSLCHHQKDANAITQLWKLMGGVDARYAVRSTEFTFSPSVYMINLSGADNEILRGNLPIP